MTTTIRSNSDGSKSYIAVGGTDVVTLGTQGIEAGSFKPGAIAANDFADGALIENSGNGIGYGIGAGGTVTQATSKSTAVTLNKPTGRITMNAASLASGTKVTFLLNNTLITSTDGLIASVAGGSSVPDDYIVTSRCANNAAAITVANRNAGALAEAVILGFWLVKGATS